MADSKHLVVVGAGPGGYAAAFLAADLGLQVTMIDDAPNPGGVCLYRGCIPSKALLHVAKLLHEAQAAADWGVKFGQPEVDLDRLRAWKEGVVAKLTGGLGTLTTQRKVSLHPGPGAIFSRPQFGAGNRRLRPRRARWSSTARSSPPARGRPGSGLCGWTAIGCSTPPLPSSCPTSPGHCW